MLALPSSVDDGQELSRVRALKPIVIDLYCGLGGWAEGFLSQGYTVIGIDNVRHDYGTGGYPGQLVLQDATTLHGSQFKDATVIVASPPCTEYSYMAMPWKRGKQIARALRSQDEFPEDYKGSRTREELNLLFDTCFRLQREASEAAGRYIPLVVENVKGAQPWVGRAAWHHGSFYLWGDVPALMPITLKAQKFNPDGTAHGQGSWFAIADSKNRGAHASKNNGGSWFNRAHNTESGVGQNPVNRVSGAEDGTKHGGDWFSGYGGGFGWDHSQMRQHSSKSPARKAATAQIAKIPFPLARHIAEVYKPVSERERSKTGTSERP